MCARRVEIVWQEERETLFGLYKQEPDPEIRIRLHALWLLRQGDTVAEVVKALGVHERSVRRWIAWYRAGGVAEVSRRRRSSRQGRAPWLTPEQEEQLKAKAAEGAFRTIHDAVGWVRATFGVEYTYWGMRSLFERLKIKRKVPRPRAVKADPEAQEAWKKGGSKPLCERIGEHRNSG